MGSSKFTNHSYFIYIVRKQLSVITVILEQMEWLSYLIREKKLYLCANIAVQICKKFYIAISKE